MKAILLESHDIAPEARHFVFEVPEIESLSFKPGQFVSFSEEVVGRRVTRAYSVASAPNGNRFELCLNRVKEGTYSPWMFAKRPGDSIEMKGPLGHFIPKDPFRDSVFVATGTGVAPFRSYLKSHEILAHPARITLLFGARREEDLLYRAEFEELAASRPNFHFLPTLTRPEPGWAGLTGRVQAHLDDALAGRKDVDIYICGLKAMVDGVRELLKSKGFERRQIVTEKYD